MLVPLVIVGALAFLWLRKRSSDAAAAASSVQMGPPALQGGPAPIYTQPALLAAPMQPSPAPGGATSRNPISSFTALELAKMGTGVYAGLTGTTSDGARVNPDGSITFPNGATYNPGTGAGSTSTNPDGSLTTVYKDGSVTTINPDGSIIQQKADGSTYIDTTGTGYGSTGARSSPWS